MSNHFEEPFPEPAAGPPRASARTDPARNRLHGAALFSNAPPYYHFKLLTSHRKQSLVPAGAQTDQVTRRLPDAAATADGGSAQWELSARLEPFDSYWQAPENVEKGYSSFGQYYRHNYLPHMPQDRAAQILVISCGPGYLLNMLKQHGYTNVLGIDSDPKKISHAVGHNLNCRTERAFPFLAGHIDAFDVIIPEQELNHLTLSEQIEFLRLCRGSLHDGGLLFVYGLNGANPLVASENLAHNIDHFNTFTEYSLAQVLKLADFKDVRVLPLKIYVFWKNPVNYIGLAFTTLMELFFRLVYKMYGKNVRVLSKKVAATAVK